MVDTEAIVPVIIKAPNQKIDDLLVKCDPSWTVHELKSHLSQVYPSKPHPSGQKLIYSGKLLLDTMVVTDVLKSYNGQQNNTIHLVCSLTRDNIYFDYNKPNQKKLVVTRPTEETAPVAGPELADVGESSTNSFSASEAAPSSSEKDYTHIYNERAYLMNSYMQYISKHLDWSVRNNPPPIFLNNEEPQETVRNNFNNQPENEENVADDERQANRDWLDWVYILSRLIVLFTVVYFYSSPLRCIMVTAMALILYHLGMFRLRQFPLNNIFNNINNNNINNNNNNAPEQEPVDEQQEDLSINRETIILTDRFSWIKMVFNFIISFLLSLVPDNRDN